MVRRWSSLALLASLLGCPRAQPVSSEPGGETSVADEPAPEPSDPAPTGVCGSVGRRFADYAWVPDDSRLTTAILRDDPQLAEALRTLADALEQRGASLPIRAAMDFRNLGLQLGMLDRVLATVELDPGELVELHGPDGDVVWLWPSDCPTATLATRMLDRFGVLVRLDFQRPGLRVGAAPDGGEFPFDFVLLDERLVALAPRGRGQPIGAWLSAPHTDEDGPGQALASLEPAPIRSVLSGPSLLGEPDRPTPASGRHQKIRVTASAAEFGEPAPDP